MGLDHACGNGRHTFEERGLDLYQTPACATEALLRTEQIPHNVWEPAAGRGAIVNVLRAHGHAVICGDIKNYGFPLHSVRDFLTTVVVPIGCEAIVTNSAVQDRREVYRTRARAVAARRRASPTSILRSWIGQTSKALAAAPRARRHSARPHSLLSEASADASSRWLGGPQGQ